MSSELYSWYRYNFIKNCQIIFSLYVITRKYGRSSLSTFSPAFSFVTIFFFNLRYLRKCAVISYSDFNLYIANGKWHSTYFHVFICHLEILFGKMSVHVFCLFYNWIYFNFGFGEFFTYSRYKTFLSYVICKYFISVCSLVF